MRYVMRQKLWAWGDDFVIKDEAGSDRFFVDGKALSFGDKLSFQDMAGNELAFIRQRLLTWGPTYEIYRGGQLVAVMKQKLFTFLRYKFTVDETATPQPVDLEIEGDFWAHEYGFARNGRPAGRDGLQAVVRVGGHVRGRRLRRRRPGADPRVHRRCGHGIG